MKLLLDTHTVLWWLADDDLADAAADAIADPDNLVMVSAVSVWEAAIKASVGKLDVPEPLEVAFARLLMPSVENIAMVIYRLLRPKFSTGDRARLASVTVWETPKTWCEYSE